MNWSALPPHTTTLIAQHMTTWADTHNAWGTLTRKTIKLHGTDTDLADLLDTATDPKGWLPPYAAHMMPPITVRIGLAPRAAKIDIRSC